jgi:hypothetical protein
MFQNTFEVAIYFVDSGSNANKFHLYLENIQDSKQSQFILSAKSAQELYSKAFEISNKAYKSNTLAFAIKQRNQIEQQEQLSLGVGRGYLHRGNQDKATFHFSRANTLFKQRSSLENEIVKLLGLNLPQEIVNLNEIQF